MKFALVMASVAPSLHKFPLEDARLKFLMTLVIITTGLRESNVLEFGSYS